jgi:hypothetical protein
LPASASASASASAETRRSLTPYSRARPTATALAPEFV